jgi:hypothetical protein
MHFSFLWLIIHNKTQAYLKNNNCMSNNGSACLSTQPYTLHIQV